MKGSIYKRGKTWWVAWYETLKDGRRKQRYESSRSARRVDAVTLLNTRLYESRHRKPRAGDADPTRVTYEEVRDHWTANSPAHFDVLRTGSQKGQRTFAGRKHLDACFAGARVVNIDTEDLYQLQKALLAKGLGNGIDKAMTSLRTMLNFAVANNFRGLRSEHLPPRFPMLRKPAEAPVPIADEFFEPLCRALAEPWQTAFVLAFHHGLRLDEIGRLRWEHVDLARERLHLPTAKTGAWRYVPLLLDAADRLAALRPGKPDQLVFPEVANRTARARVWRRAAVRAGCGAWYCRACGARCDDGRCSEHGILTERKRRFAGGSDFCDTRSTAIRRLTNAGIPLIRVLQMVGHKPQELKVHMGYNVPIPDEDLALIRQKYEAAYGKSRPAGKVRVLRKRS